MDQLNVLELQVVPGRVGEDQLITEKIELNNDYCLYFFFLSLTHWISADQPFV